MTTRAVIIRAEAGAPLRAAELDPASRAAAEGRIVVFPTDTVYGIGTSALAPGAPERLYRIKGRDYRKPLPILVHSVETARRWVDLTSSAEALAGKFWPGPLTLVLRPTREGRCLLSPGSSTLAIRVPDHPVTQRLIEASGAPWASTSANRSGAPPIIEGARAAADYGGVVDFIVDAGRTGGTASTVVDAAGPTVRVLREGTLSRGKIEDALK